MSHGIVRTLGWEYRDGKRRFMAHIEFLEGPPDNLSFGTVWNAVPVRIVEVTDAPRSGTETEEAPRKVDTHD